MTVPRRDLADEFDFEALFLPNFCPPQTLMISCSGREAPHSRMGTPYSNGLHSDGLPASGLPSPASPEFWNGHPVSARSRDRDRGSRK